MWKSFRASGKPKFFHIRAGQLPYITGHETRRKERPKNPPQGEKEMMCLVPVLVISRSFVIENVLFRKSE